MMMDKIGGNREFKMKYLDEVKQEYSESTQKNVDLLLRTAKFYEETFKKDVYEFNLSEMTEMLKAFRTKTVNALKHRMSVYSSYINRAIEEGLTNNNVLDMIMPDEYADLIDKEATKHRYITREELFNDISYLVNAQDQVIFALLFDGIMGKNYENLLNLKISDIDEKTLAVKLPEDTENVVLSDDTYNIVQIAIAEDTYDTYSKSEIVYPLPKNEYVVRAPKRPKGNELEPVRANSIRTKIDLFKKDLGMEGLTGRSIYLSGVAERCLKRFGEDIDMIELEGFLKSNNIRTNTSEMMGIIKILIEKM